MTAIFGEIQTQFKTKLNITESKPRPQSYSHTLQVPPEGTGRTPEGHKVHPRGERAHPREGAAPPVTREQASHAAKGTLPKGSETNCFLPGPGHPRHTHPETMTSQQATVTLECQKQAEAAFFCERPSRTPPPGCRAEDAAVTGRMLWPRGANRCLGGHGKPADTLST